VEARRTYIGSGISKSFVAVAAVLATVGLGVTAGVVAKNLSVPAAVPAHIAQGLGGPAQDNPAYRGGTQIVGGQAAPIAVGPDDRLSPAYMQVDTRGVKAAISNLQVDNRGLIPAEAFGPVNGFSSWQGAATPNSFLGPDAQERNSQLAAQARTTKAHGYI
jgi:hypothetical protein